MSSDDEDRPGTRVPWDDLSTNERRQFSHILQEAGLDVSVEESEKFYGHRERVEAEVYRRSRMPDYDPAHDTHYGHIQEDGADAMIELYGVGEFAPNVEGAGTPVFEAKTENGSYLTFCLSSDDVGDEWLRAFHANSYEEGEFSLLLDRVLRHFQGSDPQPKEVVFTTVVTEFLEGGDLDEKLHGFERRTVEIPDTVEEVDELVGEWDPR